MKIYFTCSTAEFEKHQDKYFAIRDYLVKYNHVLTHDWLHEVDKRLVARQKNITDIKQIYKQCVRGINDAELVIVEDTVSNFSTGHQITLALQRNKPTLVLWNHQKNMHFNQTFIQGVESALLEVKKYQDNSLTKTLAAFINKYADHQKRTRFNLVLTEIERQYLEWAKHNLHLTRTKIIRKSIRERIERDKKYQEYLATKDRFLYDENI